jgi:hypothetical protein
VRLKFGGWDSEEISSIPLFHAESGGMMIESGGYWIILVVRAIGCAMFRRQRLWMLVKNVKPNKSSSSSSSSSSSTSSYSLS